jgi:hypothetical protein
MAAVFSVGKAGETAVKLVLFAFALALSVQNGLSGFTFDSDPLYYGGYMVANGLFPYIDWGASYSTLPVLIEGGLMRLLGAGWHVTVLHAGLCNALYTVLAFILFRQFGLGWVSAVAYAAGSAVIYYAPIGYGTPDKPSFLFLMVALVLQGMAMRTTRPRMIAGLYAGVALAGVASLFAKLNPSVLYIVPLFAMFLGAGGSRHLPALAGMALAVLLLAAGAAVVEIRHPGFLSELFYYAVRLPLVAGSERMGGEGGFAYTKLADYTRYPTFNLLYALMVAGGVMLWLRREVLSAPGMYRALVLPVVLGVSFWAITVFHISHIAQPWPAHVTLVLPGVALLHAALAAGLRSLAPRRNEAMEVALKLLAVVLLVYTAFDAKEYQRVVGKRRAIFDLELDQGAMSARGAVGIEAFRYLRWIPWAGDPGLDGEIRDVVAAMNSVPGNVFVAGMPNHYYVFAGKAPLLPTYVVLAGHTSPSEGTPEEARLIARFGQNLQTADVRHVVMNRRSAEGPGRAFLASRYVCKITGFGTRAVLAELCGNHQPDYARLTPILYRLIPRQAGEPSLD